MLMAKKPENENPRMPFPSFTLALSRQEGSNNDIQERNFSNVEPPIDLMVSFMTTGLSVLRLSY